MELISRNKAKELGLKKYFPGSICKHGHISERSVHNHNCLACVKLKAKIKYYLNHEKNKKKSRDRARTEEYKQRKIELRKNPEYRKKEREREKLNRPPLYSVEKQSFVIDKKILGKERAREYARIYYHHNKEKLKNKKKKSTIEKRKIYIKNWQSIYIKTEEGIASNFMRKSLSRCLYNKNNRTQKILGYCKEDLILHLEKQFEEWMSWDNHGEWHIDHIKPISQFLKEGVSDPKTINAINNLRPIRAKENLSKGAKYYATQ
jgi:hypothetical protein